MEPLVAGYAGIVCDLDGVVYRGPNAVDHAVDALSAVSAPVVYATNNASRPPQEVADHLCDLGLAVTAADVATSSQAGAAELARRLPAGSAVLAVGGAGVAEALRECGLRVVRPAESRAGGPPQVAGVLQGYGPSVTAADLAEAAYAIASGAVWVATNTDATLPTDRGTAPGNGTFVAAVRTATGTEPVVVGKPQAPLYTLCAERLGRSPDEVLAVGDRLDTDIAGAVTAGMDSVLVLTGVDSVRSLALAPAELRPTYLVEDLRALAEPYVPVGSDGPWWVCGQARCRLTDHHWEADGRGAPIEAARAGVACLHDALDRAALDADRARHLAADLDLWQ